MGKILCTTPLVPGTALTIGGKDVEIESVLSKRDVLAGRSFVRAAGRSSLQQLDEDLRVNVAFTTSNAEKPTEKINQLSRPATTALLNSAKQFKNPVLDKTSLPQNRPATPTSRHDPKEANALVMKRPKITSKDQQVVDVVVDPVLTKHLRDHQREGVQFMYECIMGMRSSSGEGAILADEMGLGKTLQVITLLWTLLKQSPIHGERSVVKKALIVCPVTLIDNWRKEFRKWLGLDRLGVFVLDDKSRKNKLSDFTKGKIYKVMIVGYEKLRLIQDDLQKGPGIDIVIADEGHRLKTAQNKSAQAIKSLKTERRIILSGTPIQNDLSEFYFMVDFVNPGCVGKPARFKKDYENPILRGRQPDASPKDIEKGEEKATELADQTNKFILRRTAEILSKYLPPKTETVLFCRPTSAQAQVYRSVLASPVFSAVLRSPEASLQLITVLKKLCNSPNLLRPKLAIDDIDTERSIIASLISEIPPSLLKSPGASGKLQVLDSFLHTLRTTTSEKVVIVSHYTSTLDILSNLLSALSYPFLRLDGTTPPSKRQDLVDRFNRIPVASAFAMLLSAKAGGQGLNLIGASRLVLFDFDWNPSTDLQAMARIHRDGQTRHCRIYRLVTAGALDEKIYQRQLSKRSLADSVVDGKNSASTFSASELRNLFELDEATCQTHSLLGCGCAGRGLDAGIDVIEQDENEVIALDTDSDKDDSSSIPDLPTVLKASQVDMDVQEAALRARAIATADKTRARLSRSPEKRGAAPEKKQAKAQGMKALMEYAHIDTSIFTGNDEERQRAEDLVDDDVLVAVLRTAENTISYLFTKTTQ